MAKAIILSEIDSVICDEVTRLGSCTLDELLQRLLDYSWAQVFAAVDRLSRQGTVTLSRATRFGYVLSSRPPRLPLHIARPDSPGPAQGVRRR